jgi:hypothetical protein
VWRIWILTSCARGGSTSISSTLSGSPAPQHTAALHLMTFPVVSDMADVARTTVSISVGYL